MWTDGYPLDSRYKTPLVRPRHCPRHTRERAPTRSFASSLHRSGWRAISLQCSNGCDKALRQATGTDGIPGTRAHPQPTYGPKRPPSEGNHLLCSGHEKIGVLGKDSLRRRNTVFDVHRGQQRQTGHGNLLTRSGAADLQAREAQPGDRRTGVRETGAHHQSGGLSGGRTRLRPTPLERHMPCAVFPGSDQQDAKFPACSSSSSLVSLY